MSNAITDHRIDIPGISVRHDRKKFRACADIQRHSLFKQALPWNTGPSSGCGERDARCASASDQL